jgi:1-acyl-sn-glycerol-3-phosphate acyltransferase
MTSVVYWTMTWISRFILLPIYARIKASGLENIPPTGPLLIVSNHLNDVDPAIICTRFKRRVVFMAKIELFKVPLLGQFMRAFGALPVRRNEADVSALRLANQALKQGLAVCIFPEGTRSGTHAAMKDAWPGAGLIALRSEAPILPIAITGSQRFSLPFMLLRFYRRDRVTLTVGEPFQLPRPARINAAAAHDATRQMMERVAALLPESYRGYYGYIAGEPGVGV